MHIYQICITFIRERNHHLLPNHEADGKLWLAVNRGGGDWVDLSREGF